MSILTSVKNHVKEVGVGIVTDERVQESIKKWVSDLLGDIMTEKILPVVPLAVGAAVTAGMESVAKADLNNDGKPDIEQVADAARQAIDALLPPSITLPFIGNLRDIWPPKR